MSREVVNRDLLRAQLQRAGEIQSSATESDRFGNGRARGVGLAAQLAVAGIGAYAQNKAEKQLAAQELMSQQLFAQNNPELAGLAGQLSPEARDQISLKRALLQTEQQFAAPTALSPEGKRALDIKSGILPEGIGLQTSEDQLKRSDKVFDQTTKLRNEFTQTSGEYIKSKDAFGRIQASAEDPSAAGDFALVFNFMKVLDPGSTVREGEFKAAADAGALTDRFAQKAYDQIASGRLLSESQRSDFVGRSRKLFNKAIQSQSRNIDRFTGIAERNKLPVEDIVQGIDPSFFELSMNPEIKKPTLPTTDFSQLKDDELLQLLNQ
jgi:hypothetical protein